MVNQTPRPFEASSQEPLLQQDSELKKLTDYSEDGVDLTLIRWSLSLTPAERLAFLNRRINYIHAVRELNAG